FRFRVQVIFEGTARVFADHASAGGLLTGKQRGWNNAVKEAEARTEDNVMLGAETVGDTDTWIEVLPLSIEDAARPGLPLPANAAIQSQTAGDAPFVLEEEAVIGVGKFAFCCVANGGRNAATLENSGVDRGLVKVWSLEAFEENDVGMLAA